MTFTPCSIEAHFTPSGMPQPAAIEWRGSRLLVVDTGRRWRAEDGLHLLARVTDGRTFELLYNGVAWRGRLINNDPQRAV
jgi:hypothetical protein